MRESIFVTMQNLKTGKMEAGNENKSQYLNLHVAERHLIGDVYY